MTPERAIAYRKQAAALLEAVLLEEVPARTALNCWPMLGNQDPSIQCAYTMLWFLESDEDRHHQEVFYADVQLQTLRDALTYLRRGESLPVSLLREYQATQAPPEYSPHWTWRTPWWWFCRYIKMVVSILETHPMVAKQTSKPKGPRV